MPLSDIAEPWHAFLKQLDGACSTEIELHCFGGFVATQCYGVPRLTEDVDVLQALPHGSSQRLSALAGRGSALHQQHHVYLDFVTIATVPENYDQRLTEMFAGAFQHLRLFALDAYDVALAKLERNGFHDREDVFHLARTIPFDLDVLRERYERELRPYLGNPEREDLTLRLWTEVIQEERMKL